MSRNRRRALWTAAAVSIAAVLGWILYIPHDPTRVFDAIPASATFVSVHHGLGDEWPTLVRLPVVTNALRSAGVKTNDIEKLATDPDTFRVVRQLASREAVIAYVPSLGFQDRPAWVFATWIGPQSFNLRFQLLFARQTDYRPVPVDHGRTVYVTRTRFSDPAQRLSLAMVDGMLLGCISTDPVGARWLLETSDRYPWKPSLHTSGLLDQARPLVGKEPPPHWGWVLIPGADGATHLPNGLAAYTLDLGDARRVGLHLAWPGTLGCDMRPVEPGKLGPVAALLGSNVDLLAVVPPDAVAPFMAPSDGALWQQMLQSLLATNGLPAHPLVLLAVLDAENCGRIRGPLGPVLGALTKGLKVPSVVAGLTVGSAEEGDARINSVLGRLNASYGTTLITRSATVGADRITTIEQVGRGFYSSFEPDERLAYVVRDGWLFLCSNAAVLKRRLAAPAANEPAAWQSAVAEGAAAAGAWVDLRAAAKTVRDLSGTVQLAAMAVGPETNTLRRTVGAWREAADALAPFGEAQARVTSAGAITCLDVDLGNPGRRPSATAAP